MHPYQVGLLVRACATLKKACPLKRSAWQRQLWRWWHCQDVSSCVESAPSCLGPAFHPSQVLRYPLARTNSKTEATVSHWSSGRHPRALVFLFGVHAPMLSTHSLAAPTLPAGKPIDVDQTSSCKSSWNCVTLLSLRSWNYNSSSHSAHGIALPSSHSGFALPVFGQSKPRQLPPCTMAND